MSYRRQETEYPAGWLFDRLTEHFHGAEVFKDIDSIQPGDDFVDVITRAVQSCDVLLALIGDRWLTITDVDGHRRIDDPDDYVRIEIEAALARNVRVIPILVYGARMPRAEDLPASLATLVRRQALDLSASRFDDDVTRLLKVLDKTVADVSAGPAITAPSDRPAGTEVADRQPAPQEERRRPTPPPVETGETGTDDQRRRRILVAAAVVLALVVGGFGVWALQRSNADLGNAQSADNSTPSGTSSSSPHPSVTSTPSTSAGSSTNRPLFVWQQVAGPTTKGLAGATAAAAYQGRIWVAGGMGTAVRVYDPGSGRWADGPALPSARTHGTLVSDGDHLYFLGGIAGDVWGVRTVYRLDSPTGPWRQDAPLPAARFSGAAAWDGHRVVFGGGAQGKGQSRTTASDLWTLDSSGWGRLGVLPNPREHLAATTDGKGTVWFLGGSTAGAVSGEVDQVSGSSMRRTDSLPKPVQGLAAVWTASSGVCALGGSTTLPNAVASPVATVTCLEGRGWPALPQETNLPAAASLDGTVYVVADTVMFLLHVTP